MSAIDYQAPIEADELSEDSNYGSGLESETQSLTSSLMSEFFEHNGRRYHTYFGTDKNPLPSDEVESERLDMFHEMLYLAAGGRFQLAPVGNNRNIHNVLDLGTGSGIWAIDFAYENPHTNVLGIDLTPLQPTWVAPNCRFEVDDFELDWSFKTKFDYIHARFISHCVKDYERLLRQAKDNMNPGGWIELAEGEFNLLSDDNTIPDEYPAAKAQKMVSEALIASGRLSPNKDNMTQLLIDCEFTNIHVKSFKVPVSPWPKNPDLKQAGALYATSSKTGYHAYMTMLGTRVLGLPEKEVLDLAQKAYECHIAPRTSVHAYLYYHNVYGQKPETEAAA